MEVMCKPDGSLASELSYEPLPAVQMTWHPKTIDMLSLEKVKRHRSGVHEVLYSGLPAICKIACFDWHIPRIEHETYTYSAIEEYSEPGDPVIAAVFLRHVTENGRVIGMLGEKLEGEFASMDDLPACRDALKNFHLMNIVHGDVNRYNFIVDRSKKPIHVRLVDFEHVEPHEESKAVVELQSLLSELQRRLEEADRLLQSAVLDPLFYHSHISRLVWSCYRYDDESSGSYAADEHDD